MMVRDNEVSGWERYLPDDKTPWNQRRVVHLFRRAGFGVRAELCGRRDRPNGLARRPEPCGPRRVGFARNPLAECVRR